MDRTQWRKERRLWNEVQMDTIYARQYDQHWGSHINPTMSDPEAWKAYWRAQSQPWRTEPEINAERQKYLDERRSIKPDIEQGIYPFKDIKLNRADVEWLLATHEDGRGPIDWHNMQQRTREGLDLRGADLRQVDLHNLPLACLRGGLNRSNWVETTLEQRIMAEIHLES